MHHNIKAARDYAETLAPNLDDGFTAEELMAFWARHQRGRDSRALFPNGGKGTRTATADLANYASNKATAMECRARGELVTALEYEAIANRIYSRLPLFARW